MTVLARKSSLLYVGSGLIGKGLAAIAQLYAIYVFTNTQTQDNAALIFLLLGYSIWFQILELGLSQTLQNKFNSRSMSSARLLRILLTHYSLMVVVALMVSTTSIFAEILLPTETVQNNSIGVQAFSIGAGLLVLASSNTIIQRILLAINRGFLGNILIISQACFVLAGLYAYQHIDKPSLLIGVLIYLGPQILVYIPLIINFVIKLSNRRPQKKLLEHKTIFTEAIGFSGIGFLSIFFLGSDYYFAAHYLSADEIVSYYFVSRIFFISYIIYYGYALHRTRRMSAQPYQFEFINALKIFRASSFIGLLSVSCVYSIAVLLNIIGVFNFITHGVEISQSLLFMGFLYFMVRVIRDVSLVIIGALNQKTLLYQAYLIELLLGLNAMYLLVPRFKEMGIFYALLIACLSSFMFMMLRSKRYTKTIAASKNA